MKKEDIITLLEYRKKMAMSNFGSKSENQAYDILDYEIPEIPDINKYLEPLKQELEEIKAEKKQCQKYIEEHSKKIIELKKECTHPIIARTLSSLGCSIHKCAICAKSINSNFENNKDTIVINHDFDDGEQFNRYYNDEEIYDLIMKILKDKDQEEEINFSKEFKKLFDNLDIGEIKINGQEYTKTYQILIIGGSNSIDLNDYILSKKQNNDTFNHVMEYLSYIKRIILTIISAKEQRNQPNGYPIIEFTSLEELNKLLEQQSKKSYDFIIDTTDLFTYKIENNQINILKYKLELTKLFPNTKIWNVNHITNQEEFFAFLKEILENDKNIGNDIKKLILKR